MKRTVLYLLLISLTYISAGQVVSSHCIARDSILKLYKNDADKMAIRRVNAIQSNYKDSVRINKEISQDYLNALVAVYSATALPASDTITRFLNIHCYNPGLNSLVVMADSNLIWMTNLRDNVLPTRDIFIDKIMKAYGLNKVFYSGLLQPSLVVFKTETNSNLAPLAKKLKSALGVESAESDFLYGDGNDITDSITEKYTQLIYSYGWQECPTGCEQRRYWKFRVFSDCSVEYLGSYGCTLESPLILSSHENENAFKDIKIYPNPAKNKLYVECNNQKMKDVILTLTNKRDETVYSLNKLNSKQDIDLILLSNGIYYLKLQSSSEQKVFKIVKR